jgi:hypothetical protein
MPSEALVSNEVKLLPPQTTFVRLKLEDEEGSPLAECAFRITAGSRSTSGRTSEEGVLEAEAPLAEEAQLHVDTAAGEKIYQLRFAALDPATTAKGAQQRLRTLGFDCEPSDQLDDRAREALKHFQIGAGLTSTGEVDQTTSEALDRAYRGG